MTNEMDDDRYPKMLVEDVLRLPLLHQITPVG